MTEHLGNFKGFYKILIRITILDPKKVEII